MSSSWTFADLTLAAIAQRRGGVDRQLVLWYAARVRDGAGTGALPWPAVFAVGSWLHWSRRSLLRVLADGEGLFWNFVRSGIYLHSTARVAASLRVTQIRAKLPLRQSHLRGPLAAVRARLGIRAVAALRAGLPIANATKCRMLCISPATLRRWEKLAAVRIIPNVQLLAPLKASTPEEIWRATGELGLLAVRHRRRVWVARRLPNSYRPVRDARSRRRSLRDLNRRIPAPGGEQSPSRIPDRGAVVYATPGPLRLRAGSSSRTQRTTTRYTFVGEIRRPDAVRLWRAAFPGPGEQEHSFFPHAGGGALPLPPATPTPTGVLPEKIGSHFVHVNPGGE